MPQQERLARLQDELHRIPGVHSARVVGNDVPSEIHIVASAVRPPKQLVRDIQSLSAAGFSMPIDHRIVSIVQLRDAPQPSEPQAGPEAEAESAPQNRARQPRRPVLERIVQANKGDQGWVKVTLRWSDGSTSEGSGAVGSTREARARGAAEALIGALAPVLGALGARLDVEHVVIHRLGTSDSVAVRAALHQRGAISPLIGSALVHDDAASAAVRALLHAINRKLR